MRSQMRSVFPRGAGVWFSQEHKPQCQWFTSHGKPEAESVLQAESLYNPQSQFCLEKDTVKPRSRQGLDARPRSCVNYTHWAVWLALELLSCAGRKLLGHISGSHHEAHVLFSFSLVTRPPPSPQFAILKRSEILLPDWGTQTLSPWPHQSVGR